MVVSDKAAREFIKTHGVNAASGSPDAKASVVRVIGVRK
jgi:hypothetical protein